jgi:VWFA-related protein
MQSISNSHLFSTFVLTLASIASAQTPQSSGITLKSSAQIVIVDVIVSGKNGTPIHDLKSSDFALTENGKPEAISHFEEHTGPSPAQLATKTAPLDLPPGVFTNYTPNSNSGPLNVLLLDMLNTALNDQTFVHQQLLQFLKETPPGTRIAVFGLTDHLILLQGFNSDPAVLKAALELPRSAARSPLLDDAVGSGGGSQRPGQKMIDALAQMGEKEMIAKFRQLDAVMNTDQLHLRAQYTLTAMNQLALYLSGMPGRKNLMWFSSSFPINLLPSDSGKLSDPFVVMGNAENEFRETTNLLTRGQVSVYPIDARGLLRREPWDASVSGREDGLAIGAGAPSTLHQYDSRLGDEHETMLRMAEDTGGKAFINTNGLAGAVSQAIALGSNYYTLTYTPIDHNWNGSFRKIQVKLAHENYTLSYRRGYYAGDPNVPYSRTGNIAASPTRPYSPMKTAMLFGAPSATQIIFKIAIDHGTSEEQSVAAENKSAAKIKGPFHLYNVHYALNRDSIQFEDGPNGAHSGSFTFDAFLYNQAGDLVNAATSTINADLTADAFNKLKTVGVQFALPISVPVKGDYYLRIGIHDLRSNRVGAVEVPITTIGNHTPLAATASSLTKSGETAK